MLSSVTLLLLLPQINLLGDGQMQHRMRYCSNCGATVRAVKNSTSHTFHLLMSVLTCGLWLIVWGVTAAAHTSQGLACIRCGANIPTIASPQSLRPRKIFVVLGALAVF